MSETTTDSPNSPEKAKSPFRLSDFADEEESNAEKEQSNAEEVDIYAEIREHFKPLYEGNDLLGFAICNPEGKVVLNESFLSIEGATKAFATYLSSNQQMIDSGRSVKQISVEMDDIIVIYQTIEEGIGMFILPSDCDVDKAAKSIVKLAEKKS